MVGPMQKTVAARLPAHKKYLAMIQILYLKSLLLPMFSSLKFLPLLQLRLILSNPHSTPGIVVPCDSVLVNHSKCHPLLKEGRRVKSQHQSLLR